MMLAALREEVCRANLDLVRFGLVTLTWGNVSGIDRTSGLVVIKPSGVPYDALTPEEMVVVDRTGSIVEGDLRPSSDTPTHIRLYNALPAIGGITHTHSTSATTFAQACREIPCLGTTHADHFNGPIPVTRFLTAAEAKEDYEGNTATVILERLSGMDVIAMPAILVAGHAPFAFGKSALDSVTAALVLERVAAMALGTFHLNPGIAPLPSHILEKHYGRKHGPDAYYGQSKRTKES